MIAFIINSCSQAAVQEAIDKLYALLGHETFTRSFPVILTDTGLEFTKPEALEVSTS